MNVLAGEIESIQVNGSLSLVKVKLGEVRLTSIVIDTPDSSSYLKVQNRRSNAVVSVSGKPAIQTQNILGERDTLGKRIFY